MECNKIRKDVIILKINYVGKRTIFDMKVSEGEGFDTILTLTWFDEKQDEKTSLELIKERRMWGDYLYYRVKLVLDMDRLRQPELLLKNEEGDVLLAFAHDAFNEPAFIKMVFMIDITCPHHP
jgi:hypothetical protein